MTTSCFNKESRHRTWSFNPVPNIKGTKLKLGEFLLNDQSGDQKEPRLHFKTTMKTTANKESKFFKPFERIVWHTGANGRIPV